MAVFNGHVIVNTGRELLGRALAGEGKIIITRAAMGDGKANKNIRELTELVSEKITANVADIFNDRGTVNLKVQITNSTLEEAFKTEEFGIFAKIEGDKQEVLYSYCNAIEADTIPSNSLGDIFVEEHTVYIAFSSDAEADIYIKEGAVFLSLDTANKNYVTTGLIVEGKLSNGRNSLKENCQYQGDNGKWYHNIGGNRSWEVGVGVADDKLIEITYFNLYNEVIKKQNEVEKRLLTKKKNIWEAINEVHESKLPKGTLPPAFDNTEKILKALQGNTGIKFDENLLYLNDAGTKKKGFCYLDKLADGIFECIQETTTTVNNATYFKNFSNKENSDRLSNLVEIKRYNLKEYIFSNVEVLNDAVLMIAGNSAFLYIDRIKISNYKTGYNNLFTIPDGYECTNISDTFFKTADGTLENYVRILGKTIRLYSQTTESITKTLSYLSCSFIVEKK